MVWRWCGDGIQTRAGSGSRRNTSSEMVTPLGLHRHAARPQRPRWPIQLMAARRCGSSLREDPKRRQSLRSEVGTVPGRTDGLATGQTLAGRGGSSTMERKRDDVWCAVNRCESRGRLPNHHRIWRTRGGQDTADNLELCMPTVIADPRARRTDKSDRVPRGRS